MEHRTTAGRRLPHVVLALLGAFWISSCATSPLPGGGPAPVLSWPGDPSRTGAVSWYAGSGEPVLELAEPDGTIRVVEGSLTGRLATAELDDLHPGREYRYRIGGSGRWWTFTTPSAEPEAFSFAVLGDLQPITEETARTTRMVMDKVASLSPLFALQVGDVTEIGTSPASWQQSLWVLSRLGAETPLVVASGNHDYSYLAPSVRNFKSVFPAPYADATADRNTWYAAAVGPVHIAVLDTEADGEDFRAQLRWLAEDLAGARAAGAEWLFVLMHRPILSSSVGSEDPRWAKALFPLIAEHGVDAVFWGHNHLFEHYEYRYGGNGLVLNPGDEPAEAPVHLFTVGAAGARVESLYPGFFIRQAYREDWEFYSVEDGSVHRRTFLQRTWNPRRVWRIDPGIRYQNPVLYPRAASFYSYPFDTPADEAAGRYSADPDIRYADDAELFGYRYGETSIHYLWVEIAGDRATISAHYADGVAGEQGTVIRNPAGRQMRWVIPARSADGD